MLVAYLILPQPNTKLLKIPKNLISTPPIRKDAFFTSCCPPYTSGHAKWNYIGARHKPLHNVIKINLSYEVYVVIMKVTTVVHQRGKFRGKSNL